MFILTNTVAAHQVEELSEEDQQKKAEVGYVSFDSDFDYI